MSWKWILHRRGADRVDALAIEMKTDALDRRLREVERGQGREIEQRREVERRLRHLELEAEVLARRHLPHFTNVE